MKTKTILWTFFLLLILILSACVPTTFSPPSEIHITDGDQVEHAVIAVDANGRSHIAGVVADRIVYYRSRYGTSLPFGKLTMVLDGSGQKWKQYNSDIAVLDNGTAYVTWVEQRGGIEKYACYQKIHVIPPIEGQDRFCNPLDAAGVETTGVVQVIARGDTAYAVYDRSYTDGRTAELWYKRLTTTPQQSGRVHWFNESITETAHIYSLDLGIDSDSYLHVGYHYNYNDGNPQPYPERLEIRSNRSVLAVGQMDQVWMIWDGDTLDEGVPVSLSFYNVGTTEHVAIANSYNFSSLDHIYVSSCEADGCGNQDKVLIPLPPSWDSSSVIYDVEILGLDDYLHLSFIGDDNTAPTGDEQVYYKQNAFSPSTPLQPSNGTATQKYDLEMTWVDGRPGSGEDFLSMIAWGESNSLVNEFFVFDGWDTKTKVYEIDCLTSLPSGEIGSNGIYFSGVWYDCNNTMFTTQAWTEQLPLILK